MPILTFEVKTPITNQKMIETLKSAVSHSTWLMIPGGHLPFKGVVSEQGFRIMKTYIVRNFFNPIIFGRFLESMDGTRIRSVMTFHPIVWVFILGWIFFVGKELGIQFGTTFDNAQSLTAILFALAPLIMASPLFYYYASKSKKLLLQTLGLL